MIQEHLCHHVGHTQIFSVLACSKTCSELLLVPLGRSEHLSPQRLWRVEALLPSIEAELLEFLSCSLFFLPASFSNPPFPFHRSSDSSLPFLAECKLLAFFRHFHSIFHVHNTYILAFHLRILKPIVLCHALQM